MGDSCFHLLFQKNSFVSWHLICSRARPLNESLCSPRARYIWGEVLYQGASVHALFCLKVFVEHTSEEVGQPTCQDLCSNNWDLSKMAGQPAFDFAWARMSASRGIETLQDCEIRDGDLQYSSLQEAKNETLKPLHKSFRDFEIGPKFSKTHCFQGTIPYPYKWASLPAHINTATILRWYKLPRLTP